MLNTYVSVNEMIDGVPVRRPERVKMFVPYSAIRNDGTFESCAVGDADTDELGVRFIVDHYIPDQFMKLYIDNRGFMPKLAVLEGEVIDNPETDIEREIRLKEQELNLLKSQVSQTEVF